MNDFDNESYLKFLAIQDEIQEAKRVIGIDDFLHPKKYDRGAFETIIKVLDNLQAKIHKIMRNR